MGRAPVHDFPRRLGAVAQLSGRAEAVRDALLGAGGLDAERVFITRAEEAQAEGGNIRMILALK